MIAVRVGLETPPFSLRGADAIFMGNCHCRDCQKASGGAYEPAIGLPAAALKITGNVKYHDPKADSGNTVSRGFCPECGARMFGKVSILRTHWAQGIRDELARLELQLAGGDWLLGSQMSAADITVFPSVQLCLRAAEKEVAQPFDLRLLPLAETYPNVAQWVRRIETLPFYERTYPPHWRPQS